MLELKLLEVKAKTFGVKEKTLTKITRANKKRKSFIVDIGIIISKF